MPTTWKTEKEMRRKYYDSVKRLVRKRSRWNLTDDRGLRRALMLVVLNPLDLGSENYIMKCSIVLLGLASIYTYMGYLNS
jgi:hypothetical protein